MDAAAAELCVNRALLHQWKKQFGTGKRSSSVEAKEYAEALSDAARVRMLEKENAKLREERDILRKAAKYFADQTRWLSASKFVDDHRTVYSVKRMCEVLKLTRSSFYKWKATRARRAATTCADGVLGARIATVFDDDYGLYGAKRIAACLNDDEHYERGNHKRVAKIMKSMNLRGFSKRRRCVTTKRSQSASVFADLVKRQFHAQAPNRVYVGVLPICPVRTIQICISPQSLIYIRGNLQVSRLPITCAPVLSSRL